jgi:hypothetical protein
LHRYPGSRRDGRHRGGGVALLQEQPASGLEQMPYAFYYDVPGTEELYQRVKAEVGDESPKGQLLHLVV